MKKDEKLVHHRPDSQQGPRNTRAGGQQMQTRGGFRLEPELRCHDCKVVPRFYDEAVSCKDRTFTRIYFVWTYRRPSSVNVIRQTESASSGILLRLATLHFGYSPSLCHQQYSSRPDALTLTLFVDFPKSASSRTPELAWGVGHGHRPICVFRAAAGSAEHVPISPAAVSFPLLSSRRAILDHQRLLAP